MKEAKMRCNMRNCNKSKNVNNNTGLCPACESTIIESQKRVDNQNRQSQARATVYDQNRDMSSPLHNQVQEGITGSDGSEPSTSIPSMDIASLQRTYGEMINSGSQPKFQAEMYGMMLNILANNTSTDAIVQDVNENRERIRELENKVGSPMDVSERLGLAIKNLPLPREGYSELDNVKEALAEVRAPGVNAYTDVIKAVRVGLKEDYLGTVKVEMKNEACRKSIMINKKNLAFHPNPSTKNLIITNLKSESLLFSSNLAKDILKMIPGGENVYISSSGRLRQKDSSQPQVSNMYQRPPSRNQHSQQGYQGQTSYSHQYHQSASAQIHRFQPPKPRPQVTFHTTQTYAEAPRVPQPGGVAPRPPQNATLYHTVPHNAAANSSSYFNMPPPSQAAQPPSNPLDSFDPFGSISQSFSRTEQSPISSETPAVISQPGTSRQVHSVVVNGAVGINGPVGGGQSLD